jgi:N-acetylglucosaminyldiphosphoundecaprenol N-acetyl-beta-D-mannosaminyltransferase
MENVYPLGLKVTNYTLEELDEFTNQAVNNHDPSIFFGYSLGYVTLFKKYPHLFKGVNQFDFMLCDGVPFNWFLRSIGVKLKTVMSIPEFSEWIVGKCNREKWSCMIIGGTEEINQRATDNLRRKYIDANWIEGKHGYFSNEESVNVLKYINSHQPDVLLIAMSTPMKEDFVLKYKGELKASIIIPCGGMVDVFAGKTSKSPKWIKKLGLATFYRIAQEPRRLLFHHMKMVGEGLFKFIPIAWWNVFVRRNRGVEVMKSYVKKEL